MSIKKLPAGNLLRADYKRPHYFITVENDVTLSDLMTPGFWGHHYKEMPEKTVLEIERQDGSLYGWFRVTFSTVGIVKMRPIFPVLNDESAMGKSAVDKAAADATPNPDQPDPPDGYKIKHSPATGYFVLLLDGTNITQGVKGLSKAQAIAKAWDHHKQATTPVAA